MRQTIGKLFIVLLLTWSALAQAAPSEDAQGKCTFSEAVRHSRPDAGQGATEIRVAVYLVDLPRIDDADQSYTADLFLRYTWQDTRLAAARDTACTVPLEQVWHPDALVVNRRSVERLMNDVVEIQPDGRVRYLQRFYGAFAVALDLRRFPFDKQQLPVTLVARYTPDELKLIPDEELIAVAERLSNPNWSIGSPVLSSGSYEVVPGQAIAQLEVLFPAERRSGYYVWKLVVPMSLVVFMSWAAFWVSPLNIAPRIGLAATSMLTLIAFRLALGASLPPIPYLTEFDVFTVGATLLVFAALLEAVATTALWDKERKELAHRVNRISKLLFPVGFAAVAVLSFGRSAVAL